MKHPKNASGFLHVPELTCFGSTEDLWTEVGEENLGVLHVEYRDQAKIQEEPILHKGNLIVSGFLTRTPATENELYPGWF